MSSQCSGGHRIQGEETRTARVVAEAKEEDFTALPSMDLLGVARHTSHRLCKGGGGDRLR